MDNSFTKIGQPITNAFIDTKRVTKSHIPIVDAPIRIDIPIGQSNIANESQTRLKRGRPVGSKDKNPRIRKREKKRQDGLIEGVKVPTDSFDIINDSIPEEPQVLEIIENDDISINYVMNHTICVGTNSLVDLMKVLEAIALEHVGTMLTLMKMWRFDF